jgi:PAS domain-containing protein
MTKSNMSKVEEEANKTLVLQPFDTGRYRSRTCPPSSESQGMPEIVIKSETQKVAEAKVEGFRSDLGPFVVAAETTRMAMLFMDAKEPGNPIIFANDAFLDLTGYDREEVLGQCFNFLMARGTDPDSLARIDIAFAGTPKGG